MSSPDDDDAVDAGEYVLGTLDPEARERFRERLRREPALQREVRDWHRRLQPLADALPAIEPSAALRERILRMLEAEVAGSPEPAGSERAASAVDPRDSGGSDATRSDATRSDATRSDATRTGTRVAEITPGGGGRRRHLERQLRLWRGVGLVAIAASAVLVSVLVLRGAGIAEPPVAPERADALSVAVAGVVYDDADDALWILDVAERGRALRATALSPPPPRDARVYELWMVRADDGGVRSLGVLPGAALSSRRIELTPERERALVDAVGLAVSLEPPGGSPDPTAPSGPVLYHGSLQARLSDARSG